MRDHDRARCGYDHRDDGRLHERSELCAHRLHRRLVTGTHLRLRRLLGLVVRTLAVVWIRTAARHAIAEDLQLRERHAEGEQDRDEDGHPCIVGRSGSFEQHASALDRTAE